jgi:hypothetical protein
MRRLRSFPLWFTLAAFLGVAGTASADPVTITSGFITVSGVQDIGSRGFLRTLRFDLTTDEFVTAGVNTDGPPQNLLSPSFGGTWEWTPTGGTPEMVIFSSNLTFDTTPSTTPNAFFLSGTLTITERITATPLFSNMVTGSGMATWQFITDPFGARIPSGVTYEFDNVAPVPEPATMILIGTGLAGLAARYRKRRNVEID